MRSLVSEKEIKDAIFSPPDTTRAWFRGRAVARFNDAISSIQWDEIEFTNGRKSRLVKLLEPAGDQRLEKLNELVNAESELEEFFQGLG
jgi:proteasome accessory factor A